MRMCVCLFRNSFPCLDNINAERRVEKKKDDGNEMQWGDQLVWEWWVAQGAKCTAVLSPMYDTQSTQLARRVICTFVYKVCCTS